MEVWTASLPQSPKDGTLTTVYDDVRDQFQTDVGPPLVGKTASAAGKTHRFVMDLSEAQMTQLLSDWEGKLDHGTAEITFPSPIDGTSVTARVNVQQVSHVTVDEYRATLEVYELP